MLESVAQLRAIAPAWDDLWRRSRVTRPTLRAEHLAQWVEQFSADGVFRAVVVEGADEVGASGPTGYLAALPLVGRRMMPMVTAGVLPANDWAVSGDLLLDETADVRAVMDQLIRGLHGLPWRMIKLDDVEPAAARWQLLLAAAARASAALAYRPWLEVGRIDTSIGWQSYRRTWSRRHRSQMGRHWRRLAQEGCVEVQRLESLTADEAARHLELALAIEDLGWKGEQGSSILQTAGMPEFFRRQARQLAADGQLSLAFLTVAGERIAFAYGMTGKGVYRSLKVGYDPRWAQFSPGQLLRLGLLEQLFADPDCQMVESISPTPAHGHWRPQRYEIGRLLIAPAGLVAPWLVRADRVMRGSRGQSGRQPIPSN